MDAELLRIVGSVAGIGGLGLGILLLLYQEVLRARILRRLTKQQAYRLLTLLLLLVFLIALLALITYVAIDQPAPASQATACIPFSYGTPLRTMIQDPTSAFPSCESAQEDLQISAEHAQEHVLRVRR